MKKLLIVLTLLGIFQIGSTLYFETKQLDRPIVVASAIDLNSNRIYVSYITNRLNPAEVQSIGIGDLRYAPNETNMFNNNQNFVETFANYTYYSIVASEVPLYLVQLDEVKYQLETTREATVYFKDGSTEQVLLDIQEVTDIPQLELVSSRGDSEGSQLVYKAVEPITLRAVTLEKGDVTISYASLKGKELPIPLQAPVEMNENDQIHLKVSDLFSRFDGDKYLIHLHITDKNGAELVLPITYTINGLPNEQWVEQMIEEREKR